MEGEKLSLKIEGLVDHLRKQDAQQMGIVEMASVTESLIENELSDISGLCFCLFE